MMITIVLLFTVCWAPFHTVHMLFEYCKYCWRLCGNEQMKWEVSLNTQKNTFHLSLSVLFIHLVELLSNRDASCRGLTSLEYFGI